jgi:hypothetical protein
MRFESASFFKPKKKRQVLQKELKCRRFGAHLLWKGTLFMFKRLKCCAVFRITAHLVHKLRQNKGQKYGVGSACIGGGQGIAILLEKM